LPPPKQAQRKEKATVSQATVGEIAPINFGHDLHQDETSRHIDREMIGRKNMTAHYLSKFFKILLEEPHRQNDRQRDRQRFWRPLFPNTIAVALALIGTGVQAEEKESSLGTVVVSASRIEQNTLEAPANVSVVNRDTIEATGAVRVRDAPDDPSLTDGDTVRPLEIPEGFPLRVEPWTAKRP